LDREIRAHHNPQLVSGIGLFWHSRNRLHEPQFVGNVACAPSPAPVVLFPSCLASHFGCDLFNGHAEEGSDRQNSQEHVRLLDECDDLGRHASNLALPCTGIVNDRIPIFNTDPVTFTTQPLEDRL
jgi:hypothetical protein